MKLATIDTGLEHGLHVGPVYQRHYTRLRNYFLTQLGDPSEAEACVHETIGLLFFFMEDRCWEADAEHIPAYLMRIAGGLLCSKKVAAEKARATNRVAAVGLNALFDKIRGGVMRPVKERLAPIQHFLRAAGRRPGTQVTT